MVQQFAKQLGSSSSSSSSSTSLISSELASDRSFVVSSDSFLCLLFLFRSYELLFDTRFFN